MDFLRKSGLFLAVLFAVVLGCKKSPPKTAPVLTTAAVTEITATTAVCGGVILDDGDAAVTSRGVCWGTSQNPTTVDSKTSDGVGIGQYSSSITGLTSNTTYYVRAYAVNSVGTAYGTSVNLTTPVLVPSYPGTTLLPVKIAGIWWSPVNAGYSSTYKHGLLYQWHRKYGQDYITTGTSAGPVALTVANNSANSGTFYITNTYPYDCISPLQTSWSMATESNPCPSGWRIPVAAEFTALINSGTSWEASSGPDNLAGRWFGPNHNNASLRAGTAIFLPASGDRRVFAGEIENRGTDGRYWTSEVSIDYAKRFHINNVSATMSTNYRGDGLSVRCVKD